MWFRSLSDAVKHGRARTSMANFDRSRAPVTEVELRLMAAESLHFLWWVRCGLLALLSEQQELRGLRAEAAEVSGIESDR
jgi:hypothetical protein